MPLLIFAALFLTFNIGIVLPQHHGPHDGKPNEPCDKESSVMSSPSQSATPSSQGITFSISSSPAIMSTTTTSSTNVVSSAPIPSPEYSLSITTKTETQTSTVVSVETLASLITNENCPTTNVVVSASCPTISLLGEPTMVSITEILTSTTIITQQATISVPTTVSATCQFCKIDIYPKALRFPTEYVTETIFATTVHIFTSIYGEGSTQLSTSLEYPPTSCMKPPVTTWNTFGVVLTSPTTYLAYTAFSRGFLEPRPGVYGCGELVSVPLELGIQGTNYAQMILPTSALPTTVTPAPLPLLSFLYSLPTVREQLSGVPASSCDIPNVQVSAPLSFDPQQRVTRHVTASGYSTAFHLPVFLGGAAFRIASKSSDIQSQMAQANKRMHTWASSESSSSIDRPSQTTSSSDDHRLLPSSWSTEVSDEFTITNSVTSPWPMGPPSASHTPSSQVVPFVNSINGTGTVALPTASARRNSSIDSSTTTVGATATRTIVNGGPSLVPSLAAAASMLTASQDYPLAVLSLLLGGAMLLL